MSIYDDVHEEAISDWLDNREDDDDRAYEAFVSDEDGMREWIFNDITVPSNHVPGQMNVYDFLVNHVLPKPIEVEEEDIPF